MVHFLGNGVSRKICFEVYWLLKKSCNEEVASLKDEIKDQILDLKTHLYAKFGNAINLENDE